MELDLLNESDSPFPKAIEMCLKGMVHYLRDSTFQVNNDIKYVSDASRE